MNGFVILIALILIGLGIYGIGGKAQVDLGDFGKYTGPMGIVMGLAFLVVGYLLP